MARIIERLAALKVAKIAKPGFYSDGAGLYLQVTGSAAKSWIYRFQLDGKRHDMGLGPFPLVSLAEARAKAGAARKERLAGENPLEIRRQERAEKRLEASSAMSFRMASEAYIKAHEPSWKNAKHRAQWRATLEAYAYPHFGASPVQEIETAHVVKALEAIWTEKPETATRVRGRIEVILSWATARGYRAGPNPAQWRGHLDRLLPQRAKIARVEHHAALPYAELPAFMKELRLQEGIGARALEFAILCAGRTGEVINAHWDEFDLAAGLWIIPGARMKAGKEHRVPLPSAVVSVIEAMRTISGGPYVFPGGRRQGKPLSNMAMMQLLRRMGKGDLTVHGFRSTFKDWASETTAFPNEVTEMALAHVVENKVEGAYRRGDLLLKRRELMQTWADFALSTGGVDGKRADA